MALRDENFYTMKSLWDSLTPDPEMLHADIFRLDNSEDYAVEFGVLMIGPRAKRVRAWLASAISQHIFASNPFFYHLKDKQSGRKPKR